MSIDDWIHHGPLLKPIYQELSMSEIDLTKPLWTKRGGRVECLTLHPDETITGVEKRQGKEDCPHAWYANGMYFRDEDSTYDLTNTPPTDQQAEVAEPRKDTGHSDPVTATISPGHSILRGGVTVTNVGTEPADLELRLGVE